MHNIQVDSLLLTKITKLEDYIEKNYPNKKLKINNILEDLKVIEPNLSVIGLLNHLSAMYKEGSTNKEVIDDVKKTKRIFSLAGEYVKTLENDRKINVLSEDIHKLILSHIEKALQLYQDEYDI
jgi:hypothetical protein